MDEVFSRLEGFRPEMISFLSQLIAIPAIGPEAGGNGEAEKVGVLDQLLDGYSLGRLERYDAPDERVSAGYRPNRILWVPGRDPTRRLMMVCHLDVVPPGDGWTTDPFELKEKEGLIYGRGVEDNGQSLTAMVFAARSIIEQGLQPFCDIGLVFVADEEFGNEMGLKYLMAADVFRPDDLVVVLDHGEPEGRLVEVSEKTVVWMKVTTTGRQCHASTPKRGTNALRAAMRFGTLVDLKLPGMFGEKDPQFDHPFSTFEPTKKEANVPNINTVPGEDVFYLDCRLLPHCEVKNLLDELRRLAAMVEEETGASIDLEPILVDEAAPPTSADAPVAELLMEAISRTRGNHPYTGGIGGNTCATEIRRSGIPVVVWETVLNQAHAPDEHILMDNLIADAKVLAALFLGTGSAQAAIP